jgi:hypothetical protein
MSHDINMNTNSLDIWEVYNYIAIFIELFEEKNKVRKLGFIVAKFFNIYIGQL